MNGTLKKPNICAQATSHLISWPTGLAGQNSGESANKKPVYDQTVQRGCQEKTQASLEWVECKPYC